MAYDEYQVGPWYIAQTYTQMLCDVYNILELRRSLFHINSPSSSEDQKECAVHRRARWIH